MTLLPKPVEDGLSLSYFYLLDKRKPTYVCTAFFPLTMRLVMAPKTLKAFQFALLCEVVKLERTEKTKQMLLQNNKGHNEHFWGNFIMIHSKHHWLRDLDFVNQHSQSSWSILVGSLSNLKKLEGDRLMWAMARSLLAEGWSHEPTVQILAWEKHCSHHHICGGSIPST